MRAFLFCLAMATSSAVLADDLSDANKLLDAKSYPQAMVILNRLADAGNLDAQVRLGQVYWYGEGVPVDRAKGDALFAKAAAAGSADAKIALGLSSARQQHLADIAYWTTTYDGADLSSGQYACKAPVIPARSATRDEVKATSAAVNQWKACYNGFANNLHDAMPAGTRIPVQIADLMTDQEMNQARTHLDQVYGRVAASAKTSADQTLAAYANWEKETTAYLRQKAIETDRIVRDDQIAVGNMNRQAPPPPPLAGHH